jgi:hypothetical protein
MPKFVFEITEEEWQRFSHLLNVSSINEDDDKKELALGFDEALRRIFLLGLYHLEHDVLGAGADYDKDGKLDLPPDVAGGNH